MPCYSVVKDTKMMDAERLEAALRKAGHDAVTRAQNGLSVTADGIAYTRQRADQPFGVIDYTGRADLGAVGRAYAELSVRQWADRRGFTVQEATEKKLTLVNRRGG